MGCSEEMLSIVAMLSVQSVFYRPKEKQQADQKKAKFHDPHSDHLTLLNVYNSWKQSKFSNPWCYENFIQARQMHRAQDVRQQLVSIMERYHHKIVSCGRTTAKVRQALCVGFFRNSARKDPHEGYKTLIEGMPVYIHPNSALFGKAAEHVIFNTLALTTKEYMYCTTAIEPRVNLTSLDNLSFNGSLLLTFPSGSWTLHQPSSKWHQQTAFPEGKKRVQPLHNLFAGDVYPLKDARAERGTWG
jgi:ATP-dependent RNA helicase DHX8/PRP22